MRRTIIASLALSTALTAMPAFAQIALPVDDTVAEQEAGADILVIGTRASDRTVAESPVPVDVLSFEALQTSGYTETNRVLTQLVPSFNFPQPSITDGTDTVRPATLRGLSPDQTLVLINGKRRHTTALLNINGSVGRGSAAVDINLIPSIALGRVEVLRDGAAAQYGSDAIAGVINFQLAELREGFRFTATYGQYESRVDGIEGVTGVSRQTNGQPVIAPDGTYVLETDGRDRKVSDGETLTLAGAIGVPLGDKGHFTVAAEYQDRNPTNRTGYDPRRQYPLVGGLADPREFTFDRLSHRYGDAGTEDMKLFVNSELPVSDAITLYAFGNFNTRDGDSGAFYRLANDARNVPEVYPDGFLPIINTTLEDIAGTIGVRGEIGNGFRYDLSGSTAKNTFDFFISDTLNRSYGALPSQKQAYDSGGLQYTQSVVNFDVSKQLAVGFLSELNLAAGLEYRRETFQIRPGEPQSYNQGPIAGPSGAQGFPGFAPTIGGQQVDQLRDRDNYSAYAEIDAEVSDMLTVQIAGRYEKYSDFGSDVNGKIAARFEPFDGFAVRGAASTGFRAPSLQQQFFAASATNNVNGVLLETVTLPVDNPIAVALGATPLDAETSVSYSAGVVFTAVPRLNVTVDIYQVTIDNRIVVTDNLSANRAANAADPGASIARILDAAGFTSTNAARFFVNGVDTRTRGIDAVATYRLNLGEARINATAGFNYNKTEIENVLAAPGPLANIPGLVLFGRQESLRLTDGQPRTKINLGLDADYGPIGATARANRYGKVLAAGVDQFGDVELAPTWITDVELRGNITEHVSLAIGANNVFDEYPTKIQTGVGVDPVTGVNRNYPATNYVAPYSAFSPFGFNGRFVYARASLNF